MISDRSNPIGAVVALQVDGVVVVRHGTLVYERYFRGYNADEVHIIQSVTKSVVALWVGIAVDHGWLRGVAELSCRISQATPTFDRKTRIALRFEIF
jgi:CubicO group peptidase (beta-lactamase class C family)